MVLWSCGLLLLFVLWVCRWLHLTVCYSCVYIVGGNRASQYPTSNHRTHCSVVRLWAFWEGDTKECGGVTMCHLKSPTLCSSYRQNYHRSNMCIDWGRLHHKETMTFYISWREMHFSQCPGWRWPNQAKGTTCRCPHGPKTFGNSLYRWRRLAKCLRLTPDHHNHHSMRTWGHLVWNH